MRAQKGTYAILKHVNLENVNVYSFVSLTKPNQQVIKYSDCNESQGQGSLVGCCLWGRTESDTTEAI